MANVLIRDLEEATVVNPTDMLILEQNEEQTKKVKAEKLLGDYVIEENVVGTKQGLCSGSIASGSACFYRKWNSGILEIWGYRKSNNVDVSSSSWANGYGSTVNLGSGNTLSRICVWGEYPIPFVDIPHVDYRIATTDKDEYAGDYMIIHSEFGQNDSSLINPKTTSPSFKIWRGSTKTLNNPTITFKAIGHWK